MHRKLFRSVAPYLFLVAVLSGVALAQQPAQKATPSVERLRQHITYLASDKLGGRRTGSPGANEAAQYIAGEFKRLGLEPGSPVTRGTRLKGEVLARYQQRFPYIAGVELGKNNLFYVNPGRADDSAQLKVGDDWMPLGFSSAGDIRKATYEFVGYGITAAEQNYNSYANLNVKDAVAVALSGTPDGDNPHGKFARYEDVRWKAIAARNAGAKALLVIAQEEKFNDDRLSKLRYDNSAGDAGLPVAVISRQAAARLFSASGDLFSALVEVTKAPPAPKGTIPPPSATTTGSLVMKKAVSLSFSIDIVRQEVAAANVIGILEGSDPKLRNEVIVLGAHYDHLGLGGEGSLAPRSGDIHHGADDNASGVGGLLELARIFSSEKPKPRRTLVFMAFSGEEEGLLGSNYYVNHPLVPLANTDAMINMDMIGRMKENKLIIGGIGTAPDWRGMIENANLLQGVTVSATAATGNGGGPKEAAYPLAVSANGGPVVSSGPGKLFQLTLNEDGYGPSDHSSFYAKQVPVLFFWTGTHDDYHKPTDTADKINYTDEARVVALVARIVNDVDKSDKRPTYAVAKSDSTGRSSGFRVYLGTIPNYGDSNDGLLLDGVRDDSPASKAGLKAGDKIVKLAGRDVRNVYDYTYALGEMKAGQEYEIEVMRAGERLKLKLTPAARK